MKNKFLFLLVVLSLLLTGCEKSKQEQSDYFGKFQKACVRLKVQDNTSGDRKATVVGDSTAVWKAVRWGKNIQGYDMIRDICSPDGHSLMRWDYFDRDTTSCVYIFGYECVVRYGRTEPDENGIWNGVPGSEEWGFLMEWENIVIAGKYDEANQRYYDPYWGFPNSNPGSPLWEGDTTFWNANRSHYDTLGYIPNSIVRANRERLIPLFNEGEYSEMIKIMENDYVIYTCTGEEYRELARQGLN